MGSAEAAEGEADGPATAWLPRAVIFAQNQEAFLQTRELTAKSLWAGSGSTHTLAHVRTGTGVQGAPVSLSHPRTHVTVHPAWAPTCDMRVPARALVDMCVTHVWTRVPPAHTLTQPRALEPGKPSCPASPKPQVPTQLTQVSGFTRGAPRRHAACPSRPSLPSGGSERPRAAQGPLRHRPCSPTLGTIHPCTRLWALPGAPCGAGGGGALSTPLLLSRSPTQRAVM